MSHLDSFVVILNIFCLMATFLAVKLFNSMISLDACDSVPVIPSRLLHYNPWI